MPRIQTFTYLPERYKQRFQRQIADVDPDHAFAGWHDEHWDGRVDATARPMPVHAKPSVSMDWARDPIPTVLRNLRLVAASEKRKLMEIINKRTFTKR